MKNKKALKEFQNKVERYLLTVSKCNCIFAFGSLKFCNDSCKPSKKLIYLNEHQMKMLDGAIKKEVDKNLQGDLTEEEYKKKFKKFNRY